MDPLNTHLHSVIIRPKSSSGDGICRHCRRCQAARLPQLPPGIVAFFSTAHAACRFGRRGQLFTVEDPSSMGAVTETDLPLGRLLLPREPSDSGTAPEFQRLLGPRRLLMNTVDLEHLEFDSHRYRARSTRHRGWPGEPDRPAIINQPARLVGWSMGTLGKCYAYSAHGPRGLCAGSRPIRRREIKLTPRI